MAAPRPVHPRPVQTHGLFGIPFVRQHMMVDKRWTPNSLTEQFKGMTNLLTKRLAFKKLDALANRKRYLSSNRNLRRQCRDGRSKLQMCMDGENTKIVRNYLINHKDMQRLYQKMPLHMVVDNINQRTFVMRKERDRLRFRLEQLKETYKKKLLERAVLENRIKYQNEYVLEEEIKSRVFRKKIENSNIRLKAITTINGTYKKMIQILRHDGIFYEPILRSLSKDIENQSDFIKHVLYLGLPAIESFKKLSEEYRQMEDRSHKNLQVKLQMMANYKKDSHKRVQETVKSASKEDVNLMGAKRYVRETHSMLFLKSELEAIETTIKQIKFATLCSQAKEIYPRIKSQIENNEKLKKVVKNNDLGHRNLLTKMKRADVLEGVLVNNLSEEELKRLNRIKELQTAIEIEDEFEVQTLEHMKNRGDAYVLLRHTMWNLNDILRNVDRSAKIGNFSYPNSYLNLPLLKFEMLTMRAWPPEVYEENIDKIVNQVKRKVYKLMKVFETELSPENMSKNVDEYHYKFLASKELEESEEVEQNPEEKEEFIPDSKTLQNVPNRKQIKAHSAKIVEELSKKDD